jgi:hypothetical protein
MDMNSRYTMQKKHSLSLRERARERGYKTDN